MEPRHSPPERAQWSANVTTVAKISERGWLLTGTALPQLSATVFGDRLEMPKVSPGHTELSPGWFDTWMGAVSQPFVIE